MANKTSVLITVLVLVIVILLAAVLYAFVIKPAISGYTVQKQTEGVQIAVNSILAQIQQNGFVQIPYGPSGNQTLILVPYTQPSDQAAQPATETPVQ